MYSDDMTDAYPSMPIPLIRSINENRKRDYFSIVENCYPELPVGSTVLFEWSLDPFLPRNHRNDMDVYEYELGYVVIREGGQKDFIYEKREGDIETLKASFTKSCI